MSAGCPLARSFCHGTARTAAASCSCPKTNPYLHGVALYDPRPLPLYIVCALNTPRRAGVRPRIVCSLSASRCYNLCCLPSVYIQGAAVCAPSSMSLLLPPAERSRDVGRASLACTASTFLPCKKDAPLGNALVILLD